VVAQQDGSPPRSGIVLSGIVPPLADGFYPRTESAPDLAGTLRPGETVVLTHGDENAVAPTAQGGTGKTQLAVEFSYAMWNSRAVEVLVWVTAASREAVVAGFAQAASTVDADIPDEDAEQAAARFAAWLAHTRRPWALVIDGLRDTADLAGLWPSGQSGRVVITTALPASELAGTKELASSAARITPVGGFTRREALAYLSSRLNDYPDQRVEALDLGEDLDGMPLALAQATAVMNAHKLGCREYRAAFSDRRKHMNDIDGASSAVVTTWSLAVECAHDLPPARLAWPALVLAAMLDHNGIPGAVLTSPAACGYIAGRPSTAGGQDQNMIRAAINNLAQAGLVTIDPASAVRTVRMHASVQAAVRAWLPRGDLEQAVLTSADALCQTWTTGMTNPQLDQALRDCASALRSTDASLQGLLWKPEAHPLLFRVGESLEASRFGQAAIAYWQSMVTASTRLHGSAHANAVVARDRLAAAYESAGLADEAISVFQTALADRERNQGPEHPETIAARGHLAHAYQSADRPSEAVVLYARTVADCEQMLGSAHPSTFTARASLAAAYDVAGLATDAIGAYQQLVADADRQLGSGHPTTLAARAGLGAACQAAGRHKEAIEALERALSDQERMHGRDHPDAIATRASLASAFRAAGKPKDAIAQYERVLADRERVAGPDHPDTIAARANLAFAYRSAGRLRDAIPAYQRTLADRERVQGRDHRDTLIARSNLAGAYQQARRLTDAIPQYERALADSERMLGPGDVETLTTRCNLASAYYTVGRLVEVVALLQRALTDCERYLGPDHPMTSTVRENLDAATRALRPSGGTMASTTYDFVIVGGGSAGSALANRLSADRAVTVLVLEAGRPDYIWDPYIHMPAALTFPIGNRFYDWQYSSEPEPHLNNRRIYHARGKVLGGSSSINGMIFQRGNPLDYERWAADPGMADWDYAHCLPYFKKMENCLAAADDDPFRGKKGPLVLERGPAASPLFRAFFAAVQQAGYPLTDDVNGYRQEGFSSFDRNIHNGRRLSAARAYLHPVLTRPNLTVITRAMVHRVVFDGTRATGVEYSRLSLLGRPRGTAAERVRAGEVILCGGAINSPQLLQLSGIGDAQELRALGIGVVADVPGVGQNLQDHLEVYIQYGCKQPVSVAPALKWRNRPAVAAKWLLRRAGPGATNHFEGGGFVRGNDDVKYPNLMFHFLPIAVRYDGSQPAGGHGYQVHIGPMYSDSRGTVKIRSADPFTKPRLVFNYLSTQTDRREWVEAIGVARHILCQPAFDEFNAGELSPGPRVAAEEDILAWVATDAETALHPSCTAKMGTDAMSVTDPKSMCVHGSQGLRVVDASVMPYVTNGNIYAPVMMTAEKAADLILGNTPLPAEAAEYYRNTTTWDSVPKN
jgi:choline dehydrogenase